MTEFLEPQINPPDIASIRESHHANIFIFCAETGEDLCGRFNIVYADERAGWFVYTTPGPFKRDFHVRQQPIKIDKTLSAPEFRSSNYKWEPIEPGVYQGKLL